VNVFIIMNEWTDIDNSTGVAIVDAKYFTSESDAWDALSLVAQSYDEELSKDETSFSLEDHEDGLQYEEYYIQELTKGND